jgi:Zn-dependent M28 family amino/carboxypeptidase
VQNSLDVPWIILGAHYDSRLFADRDPNVQFRTEAVPGANDGASGVAVLLELARVIPKDLPLNLWLVFFDGEDNGNIQGWDWILGSRGFVENLKGKPDSVIIVDMVGDRDLNIYIEKNSDPGLSSEIWQVANRLGYSNQFIPVRRHRILDDHIPFLEAGIPAVDIIDFDYPPWHTTADTIEQISPDSLKIVGETLRQWLIQKADGENGSSS